MTAVVDVAGIGVGPANLSLAALADGVPGLRARFYEARPDFRWHSGLMFRDAMLQVAYLKDLVTPIDPTSQYSFLNFLAQTGRLYRFIMRNSQRVSRREYEQYFQWAAARLESVQFGRPITEVQLQGERLVVFSDGQAVAETRNLVVATGKAPRVPDFARPALGQQVLHASRWLELGPETADRRVVVVGGGQSGAEVVRHLLFSPGALPAELTWITRRHGMLPMDESPFSSEWFTPRYVKYFFSLPPAQRRQLLADQQMASDGISEELLEDIYGRLYELDFVDGRPGRYAIKPGHMLIDLDVKEKVCAAEVRNTDTGVTRVLHADLVVLCTGYEESLPAGLAPVADRLHFADGSLVVHGDYSLDWDGPSSCRIYGQNVARHTHGLADPNLSLNAWRSAVILNSIVGKEVYPTGRDSVTIECEAMETTGDVVPLTDPAP